MISSEKSILKVNKLVDEQKEILLKLEEMKKEEKDLKMNNDEEKNKNDRNKIAVESIQKLAQIAIESLNGDNKQIADIVKKSNEILQSDTKLNNSDQTKSHALINDKIEANTINYKVFNKIVNNSKVVQKKYEEKSKVDSIEEPTIVKSIPSLPKGNQVESPVNEPSKTNVNPQPQLIGITINTTEIPHVGGKRDILEVPKE